MICILDSLQVGRQGASGHVRHCLPLAVSQSKLSLLNEIPLSEPLCSPVTAADRCRHLKKVV